MRGKIYRLNGNDIQTEWKRSKLIGKGTQIKWEKVYRLKEKVVQTECKRYVD